MKYHESSRWVAVPVADSENMNYMSVRFPYIPLRNPSDCRLRPGCRIYPMGNHTQSLRNLQGIV